MEFPSSIVSVLTMPRGHGFLRWTKEPPPSPTLRSHGPPFQRQRNDALQLASQESCGVDGLSITERSSLANENLRVFLPEWVTWGGAGRLFSVFLTSYLHILLLPFGCAIVRNGDQPPVARPPRGSVGVAKVTR